VEDTLQDPHLRAREIIHESVHPVAGPFTTVGWPAPVDGQPFDVERHAPTLGEHTDEILAEVGYSDDDINALREQGIVDWYGKSIKDPRAFWYIPEEYDPWSGG
jgi:formyl-CoA transferase